VKVAAMDSFFEDLLPSAVEDFLQVFPAVTYTITAVQPMDVAQMVMSGQVDVGPAAWRRWRWPTCRSAW
jgi:DNA-binding transcriptional LysR family regulator